MTSIIFSRRLSRTSNWPSPHIKEERVLKYLENAIRAAERGAQLTNQLLAFSRRHELSTEPVDVNQVVSEACEMLPRTIGPTIEIETALDARCLVGDDRAGPVGTGHSQSRDQCARRHVRGWKINDFDQEHHSPESHAGLPALDPGDYVMISVADTGTGMSEEVRSRAFEPFFTTKEVHKGTGLGLSMVYGFAKQSGGTVTIDSEIGNGTTVRIYLPRAPRRSADAEEAGEQSRLDAGPPSRILVVDDNSAVRTITAIMLRTLGHDADRGGWR